MSGNVNEAIGWCNSRPGQGKEDEEVKRSLEELRRLHGQARQDMMSPRGRHEAGDTASKALLGRVNLLERQFIDDKGGLAAMKTLREKGAIT